MKQQEQKKRDPLDWDLVLHNLRLAKNDYREFKDHTYRIASFDELGFTLQRIATGSTVRITRSMIQKTLLRLLQGEVIPRRKVSYTVAIEYGVMLAIEYAGYDLAGGREAIAYKLEQQKQ